MSGKEQLSEGINACPVTYALKLIGGKWKIPILWVLSQNGTMRYNELKRRISGITNMMLTQSLKDLEANGLIKRVQYMEIPPRVEYSLTDAGMSLLPALAELARWGTEQMKQYNNKCDIAGGNTSQ
ncbi:transcriptional regulator [Biomaibacter acetigenes]|uniref:Transcriptional regulator n=1 Tax=Biomaibacter acetigenes TaxID=2316383 RepID=A0A3G2R280_9FIRM|nr:helix-turn-helix domain-containing protein [Biomaibacter acetigenes]AYO29405.1 transcriptional regulator [Biomaibacter acetigenes]